MTLTEQIQRLLCKARHPSCTPDQRLAIRYKIQLLQEEREILRSPLDRSQQEE